MNINKTKLSERSQTKESLYCMIPFVRTSTKCKLMCKDRKQSSGCLRDGEAQAGITKGIRKLVRLRVRVNYNVV